MISTEPKDLWIEKRAAVAFAKTRYKAAQEIKRRFATSNFFGEPDGNDDLINQPYTTVTQVVPRLTGDNLSAAVSTLLPQSQGDLAEQFHWFINTWIEQTDFVDTCVELDTEMQFGDAIAHITLEKRPGPAWRRRPRVEVIPQDSFFFDPRARKRRDREYEGHEYAVSKKDLKAEDGWDTEAISRIPDDVATDELEPQQSTRPPRDRINVCQMWVRNATLDGAKAGYKGVVYTLGGNESDKDYAEIKPPAAWYGPEGGPYEVDGIYYVPDEPTHLAPLVATYHETKVDNQFEAKLIERAKRRKGVLLLDAYSRREAEAVHNSKDGDSIMVRSTNKTPANEVTVGTGVTDQDIAIRGINAERRNSHTGITETTQGNVQPGVTARAELIGFQGSNVRMQFMQWKSLRFKGRILRKVMEWAWKDERVIEPLGAKAAAALKAVEPWFQGGHGVTPKQRFEKAREYFSAQKTGKFTLSENDYPAWVGDFDSLSIKVDAMSTERMTPENRRAMLSYVMTLIPQWVTLMGQFPDAVDWKGLANQIGMAFQSPWLSAALYPKGAAVDQAILAQQGAKPQGVASQGSQQGPSDMLQEGVSGSPDQGAGAMQAMNMNPAAPGV